MYMYGRSRWTTILIYSSIKTKDKEFIYYICMYVVRYDSIIDVFSFLLFNNQHRPDIYCTVQLYLSQFRRLKLIC